MSIITKFLFPLFLLISPFQKTKDKCLIIKLNDCKELYRITNIDDSKNHQYLILEYSNISEEKKNIKLSSRKNDIRKGEEMNAILSTGVDKQSTSVSYNLQNKKEIKSLPNFVSPCNCSSVKKFNLGMKFKLYIEKEDGWKVYDAQKFLIEE